MLESSNLPRRLLSLVKERSPSKTWIKTVGWLSAAVEKLLKSSQHTWSRRTQRISLHLALFGGNDGVTRNQLGKDTTGGLDTERKGADIDENDTRGSFGSREDSALDGGTIGHCLIGVDTFRRFFTEELLEELLNLGDTS